MLNKTITGCSSLINFQRYHSRLSVTKVPFKELRGLIANHSILYCSFPLLFQLALIKRVSRLKFPYSSYLITL